jgi:hypothetical protein
MFRLLRSFTKWLHVSFIDQNSRIQFNKNMNTLLLEDGIGMIYVHKQLCPSNWRKINALSIFIKPLIMNLNVLKSMIFFNNFDNFCEK